MEQKAAAIGNTKEQKIVALENTVEQDLSENFKLH